MMAEHLFFIRLLFQFAVIVARAPRHIFIRHPSPCEWDSFSAEAAAAKEVVYAIILLTCDKECLNKENSKIKEKD